MDVEQVREMARDCYGYGRWSAPYWFIGLEEGLDGSLEKRVKAWQKLGRATGLSDCRAFHSEVGVNKWHGQNAALGATWRPLILLLLTALKGEQKEVGKDDIRRYQSDQWGTTNGETCVIELFGLPAKTLRAGVKQKEALFTSAEVRDILDLRVANIRAKIDLHAPKFVVLYGKTGRKHFEKLTGRPLVVDEVFQRGATLVAFAPHPCERPIKGKPARTNADWIALGESLKKKSLD